MNITQLTSHLAVHKIMASRNKPQSPARTTDAPAPLPSHAPGLRVLVAEDNPVNQMVIKGILTPLVDAIDVSNNGKEALNLYRNAPDHYDLIFMDCEMPEMDGYEATRHIREFERNLKKSKPVKIVALTAHAFSEFRQKALDSGMDDHLAKPINTRIITNFLKRHFASD